MLRTDLGCWAGVFSHARAKNVQAVEALLGPVTWYVGDGEGATYAAAGASAVVESGGLCPSRNRVLLDAWSAGVACLEMSDDLRKLEVGYQAADKVRARPSTLLECVQMMNAALDATGAYLAGAAPTSNPFYCNPARPVHRTAFIVGDMLLVRPCSLLFDEALRLKEDYDYTLQHLTVYGAVARCDTVLATFVHRSNGGGAVEYRTAEREQQAIAYLKAKWGDAIKDNPRRPNEVLMRWKAVARG